MLYALAGILLVLMLAVGGDRGGKSFVALVGNVLLFAGCVWVIALGANVALAAVGCAALFAAVTLVYQNGWGVKTAASAAAVFAVLLLVALVALAVGRWGKIAGYSELDMSEEVTMYLSANLRLDMRALSLAAIMFGLLGAAMDAAVSVATSVHAFYKSNPALDFAALARAGNAVGRDILGTTVNTVFFAGIGETIMQTILFLKNGYSIEAIINSKAFLQEFSTIMIANLACLAVIPLASVCVSYMLKSERAYFVRFRNGGDAVGAGDRTRDG